MTIKTPLTEALGIQIPVIQSGMQWVGYAELASAVSNAGGLGILTALTQPTPEDLRKEIRKCRTMTNKPFGVNITLLPSINPPDYKAYARVAIEEGVPVVETAGYSPGEVIKLLQAAGVRVIHKCTTVRHAVSAAKLGVDFVAIDGFEAAGHIGDGDVPNSVLLRRAAQQLGPMGVPFLASGGVCDGAGLVAALALGAVGVNMGTRFLCTAESPVHRGVKEAMVRATEADTELLLRKWKNTNRLFRNDVVREAKRIETTVPTSTFKDVQHLVAGQRGRQVFLTGDVNAGVWTVGPVMGVIQDIPTCAELLRTIEADARQALDRLNGFVVVGSKL